ncbi:pyridoxal phosphate biosynthetic protein [Candidatus Blochmanniella floridana]|uniref:Pyridoxine 5'-phosphate synthase n=1 Tax=Blochmanniella floridana TaxID=203907 RepID=PDXJ_BLOFL|nr:RecName: Full=Pyridoxine 5'-phosphate synthase; Short=PNP synthase [Candidatus Blochmannia floridanus]CAD83225.1 pyridoxal phosphate biosynthetic protein [Candidatus Blochmannia floridanus]
MSNLLLALNIDHIATVRNARGTQYPDPVYAAYIAEQSGIDGITVHLREDRRHITDRDVKLLREIVQTTMNLEMAATDEMVMIACQLKPHYCCLVPERRRELTTEGGLDLIYQIDKMQNIVLKLSDAGIRVSLFIDPDIEQIDASYKIGVRCIELNTGKYAESKNKEDRILEYRRIEKSIKHALSYGLMINAGHGLNYDNVKFIAMLSQIRELNIGHAIVSRAVFCGLPKAIKDMKELLKEFRKKDDQ